MKKILVILIILLTMIPCFARTYTEEEFREVYNALVESTELLEESKLRGEPDYRIDFYSITQDMINFVEAQGYTFILEINNGRAWYTIRENT